MNISHQCASTSASPTSSSLPVATEPPMTRRPISQISHLPPALAESRNHTPPASTPRLQQKQVTTSTSATAPVRVSNESMTRSVGSTTSSPHLKVNTQSFDIPPKLSSAAMPPPSLVDDVVPPKNGAPAGAAKSSRTPVLTSFPPPPTPFTTNSRMNPGAPRSATVSPASSNQPTNSSGSSPTGVTSLSISALQPPTTERSEGMSVNDVTKKAAVVAAPVVTATPIAADTSSRASVIQATTVQPLSNSAEVFHRSSASISSSPISNNPEISPTTTQEVAVTTASTTSAAHRDGAQLPHSVPAHKSSSDRSVSPPPLLQNPLSLTLIPYYTNQETALLPPLPEKQQTIDECHVNRSQYYVAGEDLRCDIMLKNNNPSLSSTPLKAGDEPDKDEASSALTQIKVRAVISRVQNNNSHANNSKEIGDGGMPEKTVLYDETIPRLDAGAQCTIRLSDYYFSPPSPFESLSPLPVVSTQP